MCRGLFVVWFSVLVLVLGSALCSSAQVSDSAAPVFTKTVPDTQSSQDLLGSWAGWDGKSLPPKPDLTQSDFPDSICKTKIPICDQKRNLYLIHVVDWKYAKGIATLADGNWYLFRYDDKTVPAKAPATTPAAKTKYVPISSQSGSFADQYDIDNGFVITVSLLKVMSDEPDSKTITPPNVFTTITVTQNTPAWLSGLQTLIGGLAGPTIGTQSAAAAPSPKEAVYPIFKTTVVIHQFGKKNIARPFTVATSASASLPVGSTVDCSTVTSKAACSFQQSLSVDQREYVTFGILIVPYGPGEAVYTTATDGTVSSKVTHHNPFFAVVDFTPFPRKYPMDTYPYIQAGLPLSGSALHLPYVGGAYSIPWPWLRNQLPVSMVSGITWMKQQQGPTGKGDYAVRWLWGFEVPISSFTGAISKATGKNK